VATAVAFPENHTLRCAPPSRVRTCATADQALRVAAKAARELALDLRARGFESRIGEDTAALLAPPRATPPARPGSRISSGSR